jgi:phage terminase Nu1 subunit (DNA packaging protein)
MDKELIDQELEIAAKIPWLLERGFKELAERNITTLKESLTSRDHLTPNI